MRFVKQVFFIFLSLLVLNVLKAQNTEIKGVVLEKETQMPVEFASVAILRLPDSTLVSGTLTQKNGAYIIAPLNAGNYLIKVVSIGYNTFHLNFTVQRKSQAVKLDSILLSKTDVLLRDVMVTSQKSIITNKLEKQTYRADQFETAKGGSATDILKNLPAIAVNSSGEISVRGSTGFLILINGKPILSDATTVLSQLPANSIENIELLTAPSAKYDADGKAGIINITTKKGTTDGIGVQINLQAGLPKLRNYYNLEDPSRFGGDLTIFVKKNKWDVTVSGNYTRNDANGRREGDVFTKNFNNNTITRFPSNGERSFDRYNYGVRTELTYTPNNKNVFTAGFFASHKFQQRRADILYNNSTADLSTGLLLRNFNYFNSNLQNKEGNFVLGSFEYTHTFKNSSKLTASSIYENANLYGNTTNINQDNSNRSNVFQLVTNPYENPIGGIRLKLDYSTLIGNGKLETGYQFRWDKQNGIFSYTVNPLPNLIDSLKFSGTTKSINQIHGTYVQYSGKTNKIQYIAGMRYEFARRELNLSSDPKPHKLNLSNLFPSVNLLYTFNNLWNTKVAYSKRVQRNNNFELNPIPEREHSETLEQGDPDLLPQFIDQIEFGVNHNFKKGSFFSNVYFQNIKNPIQRVNSVYADTILNRLFTNAEKARLLGIEFGSTIKPIKWLTTYLGANIYSYKISGALNVLGETTEVNNANWVYSFNMNTTFDLGHSWNMQTNVNYISAKPTAQGEDSKFLSPNASIKKTFFKGKISAALQWQNINLGVISSNQQRISTWGNNFYTTTNYIYESDVLLLNFSININKLNSKAKLPTSELGEKEF